VWFFPDHGEYLGDLGLVEKWISGLDPCLVHNPLIGRVPGGPEGNVATGLVELVDLVPTLLELAEVTAPSHRHNGRSLLPLIADGSRAHRRVAFSEGGLSLDDARAVEPARPPYDLKHALEAGHPEAAGRATALRTEQWAYVSRLHEPDELYDRVSDPGETRNLAAEPAHRDTVAALRSQMLDWLQATSDVLPADPDERFDIEGALGVA
jgi:arylsulfatase A-like enzyme